MYKIISSKDEDILCFHLFLRQEPFLEDDPKKAKPDPWASSGGGESVLRVALQAYRWSLWDHSGAPDQFTKRLGFNQLVFYLEEPRQIPKVLKTFFIVSTHSQPGLFCTRFIGLILLHLLSMNQEGDPLTVKYNFRCFLIFCYLFKQQKI